MRLGVETRMERILSIVDDDGSELGSVYKRGNRFFLTNEVQKTIRRVSLKMTVREAREILLLQREKDSE